MPATRSQSGVKGSDTATSVRTVSPSLVTVTVKVAMPPNGTDCSAGALMISTGLRTLTRALAEALIAPATEVAVTVATLVKSFANAPVVQTFDCDSPASRLAMVKSQSGVRGSETTILVSASVPGFVTVTVNDAVPPGSTSCTSGVLEISIAGSMTSTRAVELASIVPAGVSAVTDAMFVRSAKRGLVVQV